MNDRMLEILGDVAVAVAGIFLGFALYVSAVVKEQVCEREDGTHQATKGP